ncbi:MAG: hypothetical protein WC881_10740, partial [Elusimicrobiota bacterium]
MQRCLAVFLSIALALGALPVSALAALPTSARTAVRSVRSIPVSPLAPGNIVNTKILAPALSLVLPQAGIKPASALKALAVEALGQPASPAAVWLKQQAQADPAILAELNDFAANADAKPDTVPARLSVLFRESALAAAGSAPEAANDEPALPAGAGLHKQTAQEHVKQLLQVRNGVKYHARMILLENMSGDFGDGALHRDIKRVLRRLTLAAGLPGEAAQVFIGNSSLPNAFTTVTKGELAYLESNASLAKTFRISSIFVSLGLLRALENEDQ